MVAPVPGGRKGRRSSVSIVALTSSYSHGPSDLPLLGETIGANLARTAARLPDHEALVDCPSGRRWTYAQLEAWAQRVARGLLAQGVKKGDRVGIWSPNCPKWVAVQFGTPRKGPPSPTTTS